MRYNLRISLEDAFTGNQATISVPGSVKCDVCEGTGAEGGAQPQNCPTCAGHGKVRAQQGFFTIERTCPTCTGRGQIIKNPCAACGGQGAVRKDRALNVSIPPGVETGTRIRLAGEGVVFGLPPWRKPVRDEFSEPPVPSVELTDAEIAGGWTGETLAAYIAEREQAQIETIFNPRPKRPRFANNRYSPLRWSRRW